MNNNKDFVYFTIPVFNIHMSIISRENFSGDIFSFTILRLLERRVRTQDELSKVLNLSPHLVELILHDLVSKGYINENYKVSESGRELVKEQTDAKSIEVKKYQLFYDINSQVFIGPPFQQDQLSDLGDATIEEEKLVLLTGYEGNLRKTEYMRFDIGNNAPKISFGTYSDQSTISKKDILKNISKILTKDVLDIQIDPVQSERVYMLSAVRLRLHKGTFELLDPTTGAPSSYYKQMLIDEKNEVIKRVSANLKNQLQSYLTERKVHLEYKDESENYLIRTFGQGILDYDELYQKLINLHQLIIQYKISEKRKKIIDEEAFVLNYSKILMIIYELVEEVLHINIMNHIDDINLDTDFPEKDNIYAYCLRWAETLGFKSETEFSIFRNVYPSRLRTAMTLDGEHGLQEGIVLNTLIAYKKYLKNEKHLFKELAEINPLIIDELYVFKRTDRDKIKHGAELHFRHDFSKKFGTLLFFISYTLKLEYNPVNVSIEIKTTNEDLDSIQALFNISMHELLTTNAHTSRLSKYIKGLLMAKRDRLGQYQHYNAFYEGLLKDLIQNYINVYGSLRVLIQCDGLKPIINHIKQIGFTLKHEDLISVDKFYQFEFNQKTINQLPHEQKFIALLYIMFKNRKHKLNEVANEIPFLIDDLLMIQTKIVHKVDHGYDDQLIDSQIRRTSKVLNVMITHKLIK